MTVNFRYRVEIGQETTWMWSRDAAIGKADHAYYKAKLDARPLKVRVIDEDANDSIIFERLPAPSTPAAVTAGS